MSAFIALDPKTDEGLLELENGYMRRQYQVSHELFPMLKITHSTLELAIRKSSADPSYTVESVDLGYRHFPSD